MKRPFKRSRLVVGVALVAALAASALAGTVGNAGAARSVRGFDGSTITVASLGVKAQFEGGVTRGVNARIKRFNDTNEIKGVKIKWTEFADDAQNDATALNEVRRLVTQTGITWIVGDTSANNPGDYLNQQHVPYFGWAFDNTDCSHNPPTNPYGFGYNNRRFFNGRYKTHPSGGSLLAKNSLPVSPKGCKFETCQCRLEIPAYVQRQGD